MRRPPAKLRSGFTTGAAAATAAKAALDLLLTGRVPTGVNITFLTGETIKIQVHDCRQVASGHVGGANALAREVAGVIGSQPVITTASDVNRVPAIDGIAVEAELAIENPDAIKAVHMALLTGRRLVVHDPYATVSHRLPEG